VNAKEDGATDTHTEKQKGTETGRKDMYILHYILTYFLDTSTTPKENDETLEWHRTKYRLPKRKEETSQTAGANYRRQTSTPATRMQTAEDLRERLMFTLRACYGASVIIGQILPILACVISGLFSLAVLLRTAMSLLMSQFLLQELFHLATSFSLPVLMRLCIELQQTALELKQNPSKPPVHSKLVQGLAYVLWILVLYVAAALHNQTILLTNNPWCIATLLLKWFIYAGILATNFSQIVLLRGTLARGSIQF